MNFAAKPRAGEAVAKLVRADDQKIEQDDHGNRKPTGVKPGQLLAKFAPMADDHAPGHQNGDSRECYEIGRIEEARSGDQALQKLARVENLEPAIQGTAAKARRLPVRFAGSALRFQEAVLLQVLEEAVQGFHRKFPAKTNFHSLANHLQRRFSVQLLRNELLGFPHPKELAGHRIFHDDRRFVGRLLGADDQVGPEPWKTGWHDFLKKSYPGEIEGTEISPPPPIHP